MGVLSDTSIGRAPRCVLGRARAASVGEGRQGPEPVAAWGCFSYVADWGRASAGRVEIKFLNALACGCFGGALRAQASVNPKAETVEELQGRRKALHMGMLKLAREDLALTLQAGIDDFNVTPAPASCSSRALVPSFFESKGQLSCRFCSCLAGRPGWRGPST